MKDVMKMNMEDIKKYVAQLEIEKQQLKTELEEIKKSSSSVKSNSTKRYKALVFVNDVILPIIAKEGKLRDGNCTVHHLPVDDAYHPYSKEMADYFGLDLEELRKQKDRKVARQSSIMRNKTINEQLTLDMNTIEYLESNGECPLCSRFSHKIGKCPRCGTEY